MSYIDRDTLISKLKETQCDDCDSPDKDVCSPICWVKDLMNYLESIPAADVRPVVLCRDCRHRDPEDHKCDCGQLERAGCVFPVDDNYWCAHGEKREES